MAALLDRLMLYKVSFLMCSPPCRVEHSQALGFFNFLEVALFALCLRFKYYKNAQLQLASRT